MNDWRRWTYRQLEPEAWRHKGLSPINRVVVALILLAVVSAVLSSEPALYDGGAWLFLGIEVVVTLVFTVEYLARAWVAVERPGNPGGWRGRLRYLATPSALLDLLALLPPLLLAFGSESFLMRLVRLARILRLARLGRFSAAVALIAEAVRSRNYELGASFVIALVLLVVTSSLMYLAEGAGQPDAFGSIPRAMWWSIATLTTVGYGDVYPLTPLGRILAGATAIVGIGLIAMPTGILAAAFSDALQRRRGAVAQAAPADDTPSAEP